VAWAEPGRLSALVLARQIDEICLFEREQLDWFAREVASIRREFDQASGTFKLAVTA
jgi:hypothetical protein